MIYKRQREAELYILSVVRRCHFGELKGLIGLEPGRAPGRDVGTRVRRIEHQHRKPFVAREVVTIEGAERKMSGAVLRNIAANRQEFEVVALKLNDRVADSEGEPAPRLNGKSQRLIGRAQRLQIVAGDDQVVYAFHCQDLHGLLVGRYILLCIFQIRASKDRYEAMKSSTAAGGIHT